MQAERGRKAGRPLLASSSLARKVTRRPGRASNNLGRERERRENELRWSEEGEKNPDSYTKQQ